MVNPLCFVGTNALHCTLQANTLAYYNLIYYVECYKWCNSVIVLLGNRTTREYAVIRKCGTYRIVILYKGNASILQQVYKAIIIVHCSSGSVAVSCTLSLDEQPSPGVLNGILDNAIKHKKFQSYYDISFSSDGTSRSTAHNIHVKLCTRYNFNFNHGYYDNIGERLKCHCQLAIQNDCINKR